MSKRRKAKRLLKRVLVTGLIVCLLPVALSSSWAVRERANKTARTS